MARKRKDSTESLDDIPKNRDRLGKVIPRNSANARERARMRVLSKAFVRLKTTLPWVPPDTKLSKLDTLRLASCYIAHLRQILDNEDMGPANSAHKAIDPLKLTWPFSFSQRNEASMTDNGVKAPIQDDTVASS